MLETSLGDLIIDLETERCPRTCENFLKLCKMKYYALNAFFNGTSGRRLQVSQKDMKRKLHEYVGTSCRGDRASTRNRAGDRAQEKVRGRVANDQSPKTSSPKQETQQQQAPEENP